MQRKDKIIADLTKTCEKIECHKTELEQKNKQLVDDQQAVQQYIDRLKANENTASAVTAKVILAVDVAILYIYAVMMLFIHSSMIFSKYISSCKMVLNVINMTFRECHNCMKLQPGHFYETMRITPSFMSKF